MALSGRKRSLTYAGLDGFFRIDHVVEFLVLLPDVLQDVDGVIGRRGIDHHPLEAPVECAVLFDVLAVFVQGGGTNALELAPGEGRLEDVGRVERARCATGAHDGVDLVDEEDDVPGFFQFVHDGLHALFELAPVFGAGDHGGHVEHDDALIVQGAGHFLLMDAQGEALHDGGLSNTRLPDEDGVVLFAAAEDLGNPFDLAFAANDGVELVVLGLFGHVPAEIVEHGGAGFLLALALLLVALVFVFLEGVFVAGCLVEYLAAGGIVLLLADELELGPEDFVVDVKLAEHPGGGVVLVFEDGQKQVFGGDFVAFERFGFEEGHLQHLFCLLVEGQAADMDGRRRRWLSRGGLFDDLL